MRLICFVTTFWNNEEEAKAKTAELRDWEDYVTRIFNPWECYLACGTFSDPKFNPLRHRATLINSGVELTKPYDCETWAYVCCAYTALFAHLLSKDDWDLAVEIDSDCVYGAVDWNKLLREFVERDELILSPAWYKCPSGGFGALKREALSRWLHNRLRPNLVESGEKPLLLEDEWRVMFEGKWWNPWPAVENCRQDFRPELDADAVNWPLVRRPTPEVRQRFLSEITPRSVPVDF